MQFVHFVCTNKDPLNRDASDRILGFFGKLGTRRGALAWFHDIWIYNAIFFSVLNDFFTKKSN
jgi:hypothetical protein